MKFKVYPEVFDRLPNLCFGVVIGYGIDNKEANSVINTMLEEAMESLELRLKGINLKEYDAIVPYRETFKDLGINPNKYMSSIEAMAKRVSKGNRLPSKNSVVDLVNALSLKYVLPMGAHDIDDLEDELAVRFSKIADTFIPLGSEEIEHLDEGELVYGDTRRIRTRRWIWRQSKMGCITKESTNIVFPIDGFTFSNKDRVVEAMEELSNFLVKEFGCSVKTMVLDKENNEIEI